MPPLKGWMTTDLKKENRYLTPVKWRGRAKERNWDLALVFLPKVK